MYKVNLKLKSDHNILTNQSIFWYPISVTSRNQLISINICSIENFDLLKKIWAGRRIAAVYKLKDNNICFIYFGDRGNRLISEVFRERALWVHDGSLNYFFSDEDIYEIYKKITPMQNQQKDNSITRIEIEETCQSFFNDYFEKEWMVKFETVKEDQIFSSDLIAPHPILHLLSFIEPATFSKIYYKELLVFLLRNDFLVRWVVPKNTIGKSSISILEKSIIISKNEISNMFDLETTIQEIIVEIFNKCKIFDFLYLAVQCGNDKSIIKTVLKNMHSLLPEREKHIVNEGYYDFQPKALIECVEIHFIQNFLSNYKLNNILISLDKIFDRVEYYISQKRIFSDTCGQNKSLFNRYRFFCENKFDSPLDCSVLQNRIEDIGYSINNILAQNRIVHPVGEMWVKSIKMQVLTPPQFEDDFQYAVSHIWPVSREAGRDFIDAKAGIKALHYVLYCDYPVYSRGKYLFSLDYSHDIQHMYAILNDRLDRYHNFTLFSKIKSNSC